ncbi:MAG: pyruvate dehydrogenase (acetyl-transferring) E1 component subunit alpha [Propioniciclava sp.]
MDTIEQTTDDGGELIQLLTPTGERVGHPRFAWTHDDATLVSHLRTMVLARRFDSEATALQRKGELGLWPPMLGQEAAQVGSGAAVRHLDEVIPSYREHAVALMMGVDPVAMLGTFRGTTMVDWDSRALRFHLYSFVVGTHGLHAVGMAMGMQRDGVVGNPDPEDNGAALVYFGDGATSQGDINEALVFAASYQTPVVFFVQNNQWAISEPIALQSRIPLYKRANGFGIPSVRVDGNDVLAVQAVTEEAMERARRGEGPTFIEAFTYRMGAHTTSDDPTKYRHREDEAAWGRKDPIARLRAYLIGAGAIDEAWLTALEQEADDFGATIREGCVSLPTPRLEDFWQLTYASLPPSLAAQRDAYLAYEASFEEA